MNEVKGMAQRQQEAMQKAAQQNGNGQMDPESKAKIAAIMATAQAKIQIQAKTNAQKQAMKQLQFEQKTRQDEVKNRLSIQKDLTEHAATLHKTEVETTQNVRLNKLKSFGEQ